MSGCGRVPSLPRGQDIQGSRTPETPLREAEAPGRRRADRLVDVDPLGLGIEAGPGTPEPVKRLAFWSWRVPATS